MSGPGRRGGTTCFSRLRRAIDKDSATSRAEAPNRGRRGPRPRRPRGPCAGRARGHATTPDSAPHRRSRGPRAGADPGGGGGAVPLRRDGRSRSRAAQQGQGLTRHPDRLVTGGGSVPRRALFGRTGGQPWDGSFEGDGAEPGRPLRPAGTGNRPASSAGMPAARREMGEGHSSTGRPRHRITRRTRVPRRAHTMRLSNASTASTRGSPSLPGCRTLSTMHSVAGEPEQGTPSMSRGFPSPPRRRPAPRSPRPAWREPGRAPRP